MVPSPEDDLESLMLVRARSTDVPVWSRGVCYDETRSRGRAHLTTV